MNVIVRKQPTNFRRHLRTMLLFGFAFASLTSYLAYRYHQWRTAVSEYPVVNAPTEPLLSTRCGPVAIGICFTHYAAGSYEGYCEATSTSNRYVTHKLALARDQCYVLNLTMSIGPRVVTLLVELPK